MIRKNISISEYHHNLAKKEAKRLGIFLGKYIEELIQTDIDLKKIFLSEK